MHSGIPASRIRPSTCSHVVFRMVLTAELARKPIMPNVSSRERFLTNSSDFLDSPNLISACSRTSMSCLIGSEVSAHLSFRVSTSSFSPSSRRASSRFLAAICASVASASSRVVTAGMFRTGFTRFAIVFLLLCGNHAGYFAFGDPSLQFHLVCFEGFHNNAFLDLLGMHQYCPYEIERRECHK